LVVHSRSRRTEFHALRQRTFRLDAGRGEQIELLVAHATMMSRPIGLSNAGTAAVHFSRPKFAIDLSVERPTNNVRTSAGFGTRASMRFRAPPLPILPVPGSGLSTAFLRAPCMGASRPADDSTDPKPSAPGKSRPSATKGGASGSGHFRTNAVQQDTIPLATIAAISRHPESDVGCDDDSSLAGLGVLAAWLMVARSARRRTCRCPLHNIPLAR
jgi:hypothetical protein